MLTIVIQPYWCMLSSVFLFHKAMLGADICKYNTDNGTEYNNQPD